MDNLRGAALMTLAMLGFAIEDMFIKFMAGALPVGQIIALLGLGGTIAFATVIVVQRRPLFSRALLTPAIAVRSLGEIIGTIGFVTAIVFTPLSSASAILQATPLAVTLGAALFLQEKVGWRRWSAILVGFCGVLPIIRPGLDGELCTPGDAEVLGATCLDILRDPATHAARAPCPTRGKRSPRRFRPAVACHSRVPSAASSTPSARMPCSVASSA